MYRYVEREKLIVAYVLHKNDEATLIISLAFELCDLRNLVFCALTTATTATIAVAANYFAFILRYML